MGVPMKMGSIDDRTKYGMIGVVIIHEVGHNYLSNDHVNSDERQWTWMDEGLNTFACSTLQSKTLASGILKAIVCW